VIDRYAVVGHPVAHSRSPWIHARFAAQTGERLRYEAIEAPPGGFAETVAAFLDAGGRGLNVTVPFKGEACALAATLSPRARRAGAVNTLRVEADGSLLGDNTDGVGLLRDLRRNHRLAVAGARLLLLGAGGAARGILAPLLAERPACLLIANRSAARAAALAEAFADLGPVAACGLEEIPPRPWDLVINATAASLHGAVPALPEGLVGPGTCCYDLVYAAGGETPFCAWAAAAGAARALDGLGMLVEQAAESFALWRGVRPSAAPVIAELRALLAGRREKPLR